MAVAAAVLLLTCGCTSPAAHERHPTSPAGHTPVASASPSQTASQRPAPRLQVRLLKGRLPQPLAREAVSRGTDGVHAVVAGGLLRGDISSRSTYQLDLRTGRTTRLPALTTAVHDTAGTLVSGHSVVMGGGNAVEQSVVQERSGTGWRAVGHLPAPRSDLTSVSGHGATYVVGGYDGQSPALADVLRTRDARSWTTVARLRMPVRYAAAVLVGTSLWVFGGEVAGRMVAAVQRVDLRTGRARLAGRLPIALGHSVAVRLGGSVLLAGGRTRSGAPTRRMWWFRPSTGRFAAAGRLPTPLADSAVLASGDTAYLIGGERPSFSDRTLRLRWAR